MGCYICGRECQLFDVICSKGIMKVCENCSSGEYMPVIKKPSSFKLKESERRQSVHEGLSRAAGVKEGRIPENRELKKQEVSLRELVDKNFESQIDNVKKRDDLINNFHWVLMRVRRLKKITQEQLAKEIEEPITSIKMAERGIIPEGNTKFINKLENYLGIRLFKGQPPKKPDEKPREVVSAELLGKPEEIFDKETSKTLTISDLKEMKKKKEEEIFKREGFFSPTFQHGGLLKEEFDFSEDVSENKPEFVKKKKDNLSKDEIDDIIFGR